MKRLIKGLLQTVLLLILSFRKQLENSTGKEAQILLSLKYKEMLANGMPLPSFDEVGFRKYSGADEDGILLYIFSLIGTTNKKFVDIGCATGVIGSNTANLIIHHGWTGLMIDSDETLIKAGRIFYANCPDTRNFPPALLATQVTAENINPILRKYDLSNEIDLLSLDIDGIDYWIWKAIDCIRPRVVVLEYQAVWGPEKSVTVPYQPDFKAGYSGMFGIYSGASLSAFVKLGREKGYRLVGCHRYGYNAFFVRAEVGQNILPEIPPSECFKHPFTKHAMEEFLPKAADYEWAEV